MASQCHGTHRPDGGEMLDPVVETGTVLPGHDNAFRPIPDRPIPSAAGQFLRFCGVGGAGFLVDSTLLLACIHLVGADQIAARMLSAPVAILTTFELNRRLTFRDAGTTRYWPSLAAYAGVQGFGLACNMAVYAGCTFLMPHPLNGALPCLVVASATALLINYAGASRIVFRTKAV